MRTICILQCTFFFFFFFLTSGGLIDGGDEDFDDAKVSRGAGLTDLDI